MLHGGDKNHLRVLFLPYPTRATSIILSTSYSRHGLLLFSHFVQRRFCCDSAPTHLWSALRTKAAAPAAGTDLQKFVTGTLTDYEKQCLC